MPPLLSGQDAFFFGTFNPVHVGHLLMAQTALNQFGLKRIIFVPAGCPPHRKQQPDLLPALDRLAMLRLATASNRRFTICDDEIVRAQADPDVPTYTVQTLQQGLQTQGIDSQRIVLLMGSDAMAGLPGWYQADWLCAHALFLQVPRPQADFVTDVMVSGKTLQLKTLAVNMPPLDVSASWVRQQWQTQRSLRYVVPESVSQYMEANRQLLQASIQKPA